MTAIGVSSALYAGLGILIGGPLGYYRTVRLFDYFGANTGWPEGITQAPPTEWAAMALLGGIILLALFVLIPARTATRLNVSEALREE